MVLPGDQRKAPERPLVLTEAAPLKSLPGVAWAVLVWVHQAQNGTSSVCWVGMGSGILLCSELTPGRGVGTAQCNPTRRARVPTIHLPRRDVLRGGTSKALCILQLENPWRMLGKLGFLQPQGLRGL